MHRVGALWRAAGRRSPLQHVVVRVVVVLAVAGLAVAAVQSVMTTGSTTGSTTAQQVPGRRAPAATEEEGPARPARPAQEASLSATDWKAPARGSGPALFAELRRVTDQKVRSSFAEAGPPPMAEEVAATATRRGLYHYGLPGPIFRPSLFPRLQVLLSGWEAMRAEAVALKHDSNLVRKHVHFADQTSLELMENILEQGNVGWVTAGWIKDRDWQNYGLVMHDTVLPGATQTLCPNAVALLLQIPGVRLAGFSKMAPNGHIVPHVDNAGLGQRSVAFHVCLTGHGRMRVVDTWIEQVPGTLIVFDSNVQHEVINGPEERIVLYGELDVDIFMWKTEGLDLRSQTLAST